MKETNDDRVNQPECFYDLSLEQQQILLEWIAVNFLPRESFNTSKTSYGLKHIFERTPNGFYIYNGAFKGAMLKCGYRVKDTKELNWCFNISQKSPALHI